MASKFKVRGVSKRAFPYIAIAFSTGCAVTGILFQTAMKVNNNNSIERANNVAPTPVDSVYGTFKVPQVGQLQRYEGYISFTDYQKRIPLFVYEHLTKENLKGRGNRKHSHFASDKNCPEKYRTELSDYKDMNQGNFNRVLSRGHMAPAGNHKASQLAMDQTFLLGANIVPQEYSNNAGRWNSLEMYTRNLTKQFSDVYVVSGPAFVPILDSKTNRKHIKYEVIGESNVACPSHLYKVVVAHDGTKNKIAVGAFLMPNQHIPSSHSIFDYMVPIETIEKLVGFDLIQLTGNTGFDRKSLAPLCDMVACKSTSNAAWEKCNKYIAKTAESGTYKDLIAVNKEAQVEQCSNERMFKTFYNLKLKAIGGE